MRIQKHWRLFSLGVILATSGFVFTMTRPPRIQKSRDHTVQIASHDAAAERPDPELVKPGEELPDLEPVPADPEKQLEWRWSEKRASLAYCTKYHLPDYEVLQSRGQYYAPITIRTKKAHKQVYYLREGHQGIVFTRWKDVLYIAEYDPIATGCAVVAVNLQTGENLWQTPLEGNSPEWHSKYRNSVNIETDGQRIIVNGNESHGRYVEILDIETGKRLINKKLEPKY
jgi:hypothetical protein